MPRSRRGNAAFHVGTWASVADLLVPLAHLVCIAHRHCPYGSQASLAVWVHALVSVLVKRHASAVRTPAGTGSGHLLRSARLVTESFKQQLVIAVGIATSICQTLLATRHATVSYSDRSRRNRGGVSLGLFGQTYALALDEPPVFVCLPINHSSHALVYAGAKIARVRAVEPQPP